MTGYAAFLRAINVGGHTVKMDRLRGLFEALGFGAVATFIASGNVIFEAGDVPDPAAAGPAEAADALEAGIEARLREALGYDVATFVRTLDGLSAIVAHAAFDTPPDPPGKVYIGFLKRTPSAAARRALEALSSPTESFVLHDRELYWRLDTRFSDSPNSGGLLEKTLGMTLTLRTASTLQRIVAKHAAG